MPTRLRPVRHLPSPPGRPVSLVVGGDGPLTYVGSGGGGACLSSSGPAHDMATPITRRAHIARSSPYCSEIDSATGMSAPSSRWRMSRLLSCASLDKFGRNSFRCLVEFHLNLFPRVGFAEVKRVDGCVRVISLHLVNDDSRNVHLFDRARSSDSSVGCSRSAENGDPVTSARQV